VRNYPKSLRIGDRNYRLRFVKSIRGCKRGSVRGSTLGLFDPNRREILIKQGLSEDETVRTLLHEILHAFEEEYDVHLPHLNAVYVLEEALFDFICANFSGRDEAS
jgi:Zn-dependent peptidase ImmA (M78 family)